MREPNEREKEIAFQAIHEWQATGTTIDHLGERFAAALARYGDEVSKRVHEIYTRNK